MQLFLFLFPFQHMKRPALQNKLVGVLRMAFRARKVFGTFEKRAPVLVKIFVIYAFLTRRHSKYKHFMQNFPKLLPLGQNNNHKRAFNARFANFISNKLGRFTLIVPEIPF